MARFVVLVIDSFGVGNERCHAGAPARCRGEYLWSHPEPVAAFAATNAGEAGLINTLGYAPGDMQPSDSATWAWQSCNMKVAIPLWGIRKF